MRLSKLDLLFQLDMQLVKVDSEVASSGGGSEVLFGVNSDVYMVLLVFKEGKCTSGGIWFIVVSELRKG